MDDGRCKITKFQYGVVRERLTKPYVLSFTTVEEIVSLWVYLEDNQGRTGLGEAVPLFGYGTEDEQSVAERIIRIRQECRGTSADVFRNKLIEHWRKMPFAASAVGTALDFLQWGETFSPPRPIDLVYPVSSSSSEPEIAEQINSGLAQGFKHFKVKVGKSLQMDIATGVYALKNYQAPLTFRFDANQAYSFEQAFLFCKELTPRLGSTGLWLEQPLPMDDWQGMAKLCAKSDFPLMLDESIYDEQDIRRAKDIGCRAIKLKLFKHPGLEACLRYAEFAASLGLQLTLGNGVSSDIGNLAEAMVVDRMRSGFVDGLECNGFVKLVNNIAFPQLQLNDSGQLFWNGNSALDLETVVKELVARSERTG